VSVDSLILANSTVAFNEIPATATVAGGLAVTERLDLERESRPKGPPQSCSFERRLSGTRIART
jgi:hypothetical protein